MSKKVPTPEIGTPNVDPEEFRIEITEEGPYMLYGKAPINTFTILYDSEGNSWDFDISKLNFQAKGDAPVALCRCGRSKDAPYCDASHIKALENGEWNPNTTATMEPPLDRAQLMKGPELGLTDVEELCAFARFCDAKGRTWNQVMQSDDPETRELAIRTASACPAGRLKAWNLETDKPMEPNYMPSLGLIEDPKIQASGPIFLRGGIPVFREDGVAYQPRNRVTLCRCGESRNKPYCDGTHAPAHYHDKIKNRG